MGTICTEEYKVNLRGIFGGKAANAGSASPEFLDAGGLAAKLGTSEQWVRRNVRRTYTRDPIPHLRFGRSIKFDWDSAEMQEWLERRKATTEAQKSAVTSVGDASYNLKRTGFGPNRKERK